MSILQDIAEIDAPDRARVSIIERVVPAIAFGLASLSGIIAAVMTTSMFTTLRDEENAGADSIISVFDKLEGVVLPVLGLSIAVGVAAIIVSFVRMSSGAQTAPPPGFLYLIAGLPNLISPILAIYSWSIVIEVVAGRYKGDVTAIGAHIAEILIFGIIAGIGSCLILPVFAFVPFNARRDNWMTSIVFLSFVIVCIVLVTIAFLGVADGLSKIPSPPQL
jgi:hypothetical protein